MVILLPITMVSLHIAILMRVIPMTMTKLYVQKHTSLYLYA